MSKNTVTFGLSNVHVAFMKEDGTYEKPVPIPGAVSYTPATAGDSSSFSADNNGQYFVGNTNNGYTGDLQMALIPDDTLAKMLGWEIDDDGALIELAEGRPTKFALMFETRGNIANRRHVLYDVQANRPAKEHTTTGDTTEVAPDQLSIVVSKKEIDGKLRIKAVLEETTENKAKFDAFFDTVYGTVSEGA